MLNRDAYLLAQYSFYSFLPKGGDHDRIRPNTALLVYCLLRRIQVNLPSLILNTIADAGFNYRNLPYGAYMTHIFRRFGVDLDGEEYSVPTAPFGTRIINAMNALIPEEGGAAAAAGAAEEEEEEEEEEEDEEYVPSASRARMEKRQQDFETYVHNEFDYIHGQFDYAHTEFDYMHQQFGKIDEHFSGMNENMESIMDALHIDRSGKRKGKKKK